MPQVSHDGADLYWEEPGSPEGLRYADDPRDPLLMIMGLGATLQWWDRITPTLAARYRTILFDNRGVGRSSVPPGPYSIPGMADDAAAVLDAAGVASAHVFGASMGGMIAQELALRHPARVRSLILGCTACGGKEAVPAGREVAEALGARSRMTREEAMWVMAPHIFDAATPREKVAEDIAVRLRSTVTNDGYFAQLQAIRAWSGTYARLGALTMPTLVIHGETDELVPPENGRVIARAIPGSTLVMIPHASHIFITDQFEAASGAILSFLGDQSARFPSL